MNTQDWKDRFQEVVRKAEELLVVINAFSLQDELQALEMQMQAPDFWLDQNNAKSISQRVAVISQDLSKLNFLKQATSSADETISLIAEDDSLLADAVSDLIKLEAITKEIELKTYFKDSHDSSNAILSFHAGAGGTDAQDWAEILMRMILRYAEGQNWQTEIIDQSSGEEAGVKSATISIKGDFAYGMLKSEAGVHRLVRISPFDAEGMRHTSFALIEVLPELSGMSESQIDINPDDLRIDTFMASGKGGQSVNTTYSAIRITHIPTGIVVNCQNERSQQQNKETAMQVLKSRLFKRLLEERKETIAELKGGHQAVEWGSQIRSYVMHPYRMVKDHRTNTETQDIDGVLNGDLTVFIEAYLKDQAQK
jgi:peptide chain release factor 2